MELTDHTVYEVVTLENLEAENLTLEGADFVACEIKHCQFSETHFNRCSFRNCNFEDCNLDLVQVNRCVFKSCQFTRCKMMGINWTEASWGRQEIAQLIKKINFKECVLNYSSFMELKLKGIEIIDSLAMEVDFSNAMLQKANFHGTDLERAIFRNTDCQHADFRGAKNYAISPMINNIAKAHFSLPEAMSLLYTMDINLS
ncbi:MAG: hypothetical protein PWQ55_2363 [Chloroflexota bacterium]|nr:hypothetical protein [Chloroflexota bacterium]